MDKIQVPDFVSFEPELRPLSAETTERALRKKKRILIALWYVIWKWIRKAAVFSRAIKKLI